MCWRTVSNQSYHLQHLVETDRKWRRDWLPISLVRKRHAKLKRITPVVKEASMDIWLLIHPDLTGVRRIDALRELFIGIFESKKNLPITA